MGAGETDGYVSGATAGTVASGETDGYVASGQTTGTVESGETVGTIPRMLAPAGFYISAFLFDRVGRASVEVSYDTTESASCIIYTSETPTTGPWDDTVFAGLHGTHAHQVTGLTESTTYGIYVQATNAGSDVTVYPPSAPNAWREFTTGSLGVAGTTNPEIMP